MKNGLWSKQEVKDLFTSVEKAKDNKNPLKMAFSEHAKKYSRQPNSVRNYYYHEIDNLEIDRERCNNLGIDLSKHKKSSIQYFSKDEEDSLMQKIDGLVESGYSVRKACMTLSDGDIGTMLRFQNKYRNFKAKQKPIEKNNIIKFTKRKEGITESELQALFMGLVRLVKRSAKEEASMQTNSILEKTNIELRKTIIALNTKEKEYRELKEQLTKVKEENSRLVKDVFKLKCNKAGKLKTQIEDIANK